MCMCTWNTFVAVAQTPNSYLHVCVCVCMYCMYVCKHVHTHRMHIQVTHLPSGSQRVQAAFAVCLDSIWTYTHTWTHRMHIHITHLPPGSRRFKQPLPSVWTLYDSFKPGCCLSLSDFRRTFVIVCSVPVIFWALLNVYICVYACMHACMYVWHIYIWLVLFMSSRGFLSALKKQMHRYVRILLELLHSKTMRVCVHACMRTCMCVETAHT